MKQADKAVLYLRVSTDDKNQNPERQRSDLETWCEKHGVSVVGSVVDEGTSATKTNPFERPAFLEAVESAQKEGAAILVLTHNRFTRQGSDEAAWARVELKRQNPPVAVWVASKGGPLDQDREVVGAIQDAVEDEFSRKWSKDHGSAVASGMRQARKEGRAIGRPGKFITAKELEAARLKLGPKAGVRKVRAEINRARGLYERADVESAIKKHGVSKSLVHEYLAGLRVAE